MSIKGLKLTDEQKIAFLQKQTLILNDAQKLNEYQNFVSSQKKGFLDLMNYINNLLNQYKRQGKLSSFVQFRARIKAPESAIANDSKKSLDDVFGMELICATEDEIDFLVQELSNFMLTHRFKEHNKPNGYKAKHHYLYLDPSKYNLLYPIEANANSNINKLCEQIPLVEFQLKTIEVAIQSSYGRANHSTYKNVDKELIQKAFDNYELKVDYNLPFMWISDNDINNPEMHLLSADETAKVLYPFIDTTSREKDINLNR